MMNRTSVFLFGMIALMLGLYTLPWLVNPAASLSPNAYDLAEWASLHPAARVETPMLLTSLLLRLPLVCLALLVTFSTRRGVVPALLVLLVAIALLPPEIVPLTDNPNSRQQFLLAVMTLVGGGVGLSEILPRTRHWIAVAVALIGAGASLFGLMQSYALMQGFELPTQVGLGGVAVLIGFVVLAGMSIINQTGQH